jgi:hypothetical protein
MIKRKRDTIKVIDNAAASVAIQKGLSCQNCKQSHYLIPKPGDINNAFCTHCGHSTPLRQTKFGRSLAMPVTQQTTAVIQSEKQKGRSPKSIRNRTKLDIEQDLEDRGYTVISAETLYQ